jgi:hypothetical protein
VTPALFIIAVLILIGNALLGDIRYYGARLSGGPNPYEWSGALLVLIIVLAGVPAFYTWKATHARTSKR